MTYLYLFIEMWSRRLMRTIVAFIILPISADGHSICWYQKVCREEEHSVICLLWFQITLTIELIKISLVC